MSLDTPQFKRALEEAQFLRRRLYKIQSNLEGSPNGAEILVDYLHTMYALIDKEHMIYTRLALIDTPEAKAAIEKLDAWQVVALMDDHDDVDIRTVYPIVKGELVDLIKRVSGDDWDPDDFDIDDEDW